MASHASWCRSSTKRSDSISSSRNRAGGASGTVGANAVAKAAPDGYTLMVSASVHVINPFLYKSVPYDVVNDFTPVSLIADGPLIVSTTPSVPANNLKDLFALVRKDPQKYTFGTTSVGSASHLAIELLKSDAGLDTLVVAYKGTAAGADRPDERPDPSARRPDALVIATCTSRQDQSAGADQSQAGGRGAGNPDRRGVRGEGLSFCLMVRIVGAEEPAGRHSSKLQADVAKVLALPDVKQRLNTLGFDPIGVGGEQFATYIRDEMAKYEKIIRDAKIKVE